VLLDHEGRHVEWPANDATGRMVLVRRAREELNQMGTSSKGTRRCRDILFGLEAHLEAADSVDIGGRIANAFLREETCGPRSLILYTPISDWALEYDGSLTKQTGIWDELK
jgi:hypothetical protein